MTDLSKIMYQFCSEFGINAYPEGGVPSQAKFPYITYNVVQTDWMDSTNTNIRVWYRSTSYTGISTKVDEISNKIGHGITIPLDNGCVFITKGLPFVQMQPYDDPEIKVAYINIGLQSIL